MNPIFKSLLINCIFILTVACNNIPSIEKIEFIGIDSFSVYDYDSLSADILQFSDYQLLYKGRNISEFNAGIVENNINVQKYSADWGPYKSIEDTYCEIFIDTSVIIPLEFGQFYPRDTFRHHPVIIQNKTNGPIPLGAFRIWIEVQARDTDGLWKWIEMPSNGACLTGVPRITLAKNQIGITSAII